MNHQNTLETEIGTWVPHESRNKDKANKRQLSIQRQLDAGAPLMDVCAKILGLHRQSTAFNGNGSYTNLKEVLGLGPDLMVIDDSEEGMTKRVDDLLDELAKSYNRIQVVP